MADDDADDRLFTKEIFEDCRVPNDLHFVHNGEDLLDYLNQRGRFQDRDEVPERPGLILLDLHMPRKDGFAALQEIKDDPALSQIPVIILTASKAEADIYRSYDLNVNSYLFKPVTSEGIGQILYTLERANKFGNHLSN